MAAMRFHADLHVHSKYSRATSRDLDLEHLAAWAARKGVGVVGTGDFTHPAWRAELKDKLVPAEPGLFRLRPEIEQAIAAEIAAGVPGASALHALGRNIDDLQEGREDPQNPSPDLCAGLRHGRPHFRTSRPHRQYRLRRAADPRPRLRAIFWRSPSHRVPAPISSRRTSGRRGLPRSARNRASTSIKECYGDLADHIFAVETGLSSDPPMNWRLSMLDRYRLVSNSDAHSPGKLGREATTFDCALDYFAIRKALETGDGYVGTVEFFPEEGKYHLDGHRKCGIKLSPHETLAHGGRCPVCGGPMTIGVLHRVEALADRSEEEALPPPTAGEVSNLVALPEVLGETRRHRAAKQDRRAQLRPAARGARLRTHHPAIGAAGRHRARGFLSRRRSHCAAARRPSDPRRRLRRRVRRDPAVPERRAAAAHGRTGCCLSAPAANPPSEKERIERAALAWGCRRRRNLDPHPAAVAADLPLAGGGEGSLRRVSPDSIPTSARRRPLWMGRS